jgi:hypothetical protein
MTVRIGLVIAALAAAGLIAGVVLFRRSRSEPEHADMAYGTDDAVVAPPAEEREESVPAAAEPTPV